MPLPILARTVKKIYDKGHFWNGKDPQTELGIEIAYMALVDVNDSSPYGIETGQTPSDMKGKLMGYYVGIIKKK